MAKVILVDDDRTNANLIKMLLEMDGFEVVVCPDLERARTATAEGADAFIIDCNLSRGDSGIDLLRAVRSGQTAAAVNTPIIMTSGDDRRSHEARAAGATQFLLKPYSPSKLSEELTRLLA
ncbi:MAG: response regulator [Chloroflexi bacterium]|nr:response regulator [Chloroflexota bacterium]MCI0580045.1 response regulator [Chloroflexota bacterium]MCI0649763.1 response regulator [Chloroflexota bacterium]MCI0730212.1 response regulator [Chloroflexota bacterium]